MIAACKPNELSLLHWNLDVLHGLVDSGFLRFHLFHVHKPASCILPSIVETGPWMPTSPVYPHLLYMLFCSLVLFCQCLKTRAICQAQGWAGVRGIKSILGCEPGIFLCEAKPGVGAIRMLVQAQNVVVQFQRSLKRTERDQHSCNRQLGLPQVARTVGSMKLTHIFKILGHQRPPFLYAIF